MPEFQFDSFAAFLAMGGHAVYVWTSYAFFALVIAFNLIQPLLAKRRIIRRHRARLLRESAREQHRSSEDSAPITTGAEE